MNLYFNISSQHQIVIQRSTPAKSFYKQLKSELPALQKGDIIYFNVASDSRSYFAESFSVSQMPEETALAWRYGVDRYDIQMVTEPEELVELLSNDPTKLSKIKAFFYTNGKLVNTTNELNTIVNSIELPIQTDSSVEYGGRETKINFEPALNSMLPIELTLNLETNIDYNLLTYPYNPLSLLNVSDIYYDEVAQNTAFNYQKSISEFRKIAAVTSSSNWQKNTPDNILDSNTDTYWQSDRVLFGKEKVSYLVLNLNKHLVIDKLAFQNAVANHTPINYKIYTSLDNLNWKLVAEVNKTKKINPDSVEIVDLENSLAKFVKIEFLETLNTDSPTISEVWVVEDKYESLDIPTAEIFLDKPFSYVENQQALFIRLEKVNYQDLGSVYWLTNENNVSTTDSNSKIKINYDGTLYSIKIIIPAGGTELKSVSIQGTQLPVNTQIKNVSAKYVNFIND